MTFLERPSMAVNDLGAADKYGRVRRFQLGSTWDIPHSTSRATIIGRVAAVAESMPGGKLKNLVLSCHGSPGHLGLGEGFGPEHIPMFMSWRELIEKIWLPDCRVAHAPTAAERAEGWYDGHHFCLRLARQVQCYVVASTEKQADLPVTYPQDTISSFEGLVLSFGPRGQIVWQKRYPSTFWTAGGWWNANP